MINSMIICNRTLVEDRIGQVEYICNYKLLGSTWIIKVIVGKNEVSCGRIYQWLFFQNIAEYKGY